MKMKCEHNCFSGICLSNQSYLLYYRSFYLQRYLCNALYYKYSNINYDIINIFDKLGLHRRIDNHRDSPLVLHHWRHGYGKVGSCRCRSLKEGKMQKKKTTWVWARFVAGPACLAESLPRRPLPEKSIDQIMRGVLDLRRFDITSLTYTTYTLRRSDMTS
jgi:hypothetical protein